MKHNAIIPRRTTKRLIPQRRSYKTEGRTSFSFVSTFLVNNELLYFVFGHSQVHQSLDELVRVYRISIFDYRQKLSLPTVCHKNHVVHAQLTRRSLFFFFFFFFFCFFFCFLSVFSSPGAGNHSPGTVLGRTYQMSWSFVVLILVLPN